jgi:tripartite-type tricarboxylate transporter receptor subunit TctC
MKFLFFVSAILLTTSVQASEITIVNEGNLQSPTAVYGLAFKNSVPGASKWVQVASCRDAQRAFTSTKDAVMIYDSSVDFRERVKGSTCNQALITTKNTVIISSMHVKFCRKPGNNNKKITDSGVKMGIASVVATKRHEQEWNSGGMNVRFVPYGGSGGVAQATINGEIDWGWIAAPVAVKQEKMGTLECPYTTDSRDPGYIGKIVPHLTVADFEVITAVYTNSTDPIVLERLKKAVTTPEFQSWLIGNETPSIVNVTQQDVDKVNQYVDRLVKSWGDR